MKTFMEENSQSANPEPDPVHLAPAEFTPIQKPVGGWLMLFCLGLTVFSPLLTLVSLVNSYKEVSPYFTIYSGLQVITIIDTILSVALMAFSIYAGVGLLRIRPGALQMAKRYLLCFLVYLAVAAILPFVAGLPTEANDAMFASIAKDMFKGVVYVAIWYSYLSLSKRVSETYSS